MLFAVWGCDRSYQARAGAAMLGVATLGVARAGMGLSFVSAFEVLRTCLCLQKIASPEPCLHPCEHPFFVYGAQGATRALQGQREELEVGTKQAWDHIKGDYW